METIYSHCTCVDNLFTSLAIPFSHSRPWAARGCGHDGAGVSFSRTFHFHSKYRASHRASQPSGPRVLPPPCLWRYACGLPDCQPNYCIWGAESTRSLRGCAAMRGGTTAQSTLAKLKTLACKNPCLYKYKNDLIRKFPTSSGSESLIPDSDAWCLQHVTRPIFVTSQRIASGLLAG